MTTVCYSHEPATGASPAQSLDHSDNYLIALDASPADLTLDDYPAPQPHFIFPAAPPSPESSPPMYNTRRRRPLSAVESHTRSFSMAIAATDRIPRHAALPDFSFNPGASIPPPLGTKSLLSPPEFSHSRKLSLSPSRMGGHGHRRGGSEFVGGRIREGSSIAVPSASGTNPENASTSSSLQPPHPGRRGHRRGVSGTISTNDLPIIAPPPLHNPFASGRSQGAPNSSPNIGPWDPVPPMTPDEPPTTLQLSEPAKPLLEAEDPLSSEIDEDTSVPPLEDEAEEQFDVPKPLARARVGFSDTLEFIPRPLSLISTDTSSTVTARPGHSVSGSMSSIIYSFPQERESQVSFSRIPTGDPTESRPGTAGAILDRAIEPQPMTEDLLLSTRRYSIPALALAGTSDGEASSSTVSGPVKAPKRWSFFGLEHLTGPAPAKERPGSSSSSDSTARATGSVCSDHGSDTSTDGLEEPNRQQKDGKKGGKKRRVKGWAGSILPRKSKGKKQLRAARPPTPPAQEVLLDSDEDDVLPTVDSDEADSPSMLGNQSSMPDFTSSRRPVDDIPSPMIDLDAALGPFNTPMFNPEWEAAQHAADHSSMRRLHSAQGMRGFSGPGMHYHRRSESAPALPRFESGRAFFNRLGSASTMADVFEEDEEEEDKETGRGRTRPQPLGGLDLKVSAIADIQARSQPTSRRRSCDLADYGYFGAHITRRECPGTPIQAAVIAEEPPVMPDVEARGRRGSRGSMESGTSSLRPFPCLNEFSTADDMTLTFSYAPNGPMSSCTVSSSHPSPRTPVSLDIQRMSTGPSSMTDANSFHSLLMGEPGPEVRISTESDMLRLDLEESTMTRESSIVAPSEPTRQTRRPQRPVSQSAAFGRRRSSLASLSRLISSSYGERSKLSIESTPIDAGHVERAKEKERERGREGEKEREKEREKEKEKEKEKERKSKPKISRLSRMMQFWRPTKESSTTST